MRKKNLFSIVVPLYGNPLQSGVRPRVMTGVVVPLIVNVPHALLICGRGLICITKNELKFCFKTTKLTVAGYL